MDALALPTVASSAPLLPEMAQLMKFLTFTVSSEEYGVDLMQVREIRAWSEVTRLPKTPSYMLGVLNLRGSIIPIFDLKARFTGSITESHPKNVIVIVAIGHRTLGMLVEAVCDIVESAAEQIQPAPERDDQTGSAFLRGLMCLEERVIVLLDASQLFDEADLHSSVASASIQQPGLA